MAEISHVSRKGKKNAPSSSRSSSLPRFRNLPGIHFKLALLLLHSVQISLTHRAPVLQDPKHSHLAKVYALKIWSKKRGTDIVQTNNMHGLTHTQEYD